MRARVLAALLVLVGVGCDEAGEDMDGGRDAGRVSDAGIDGGRVDGSAVDGGASDASGDAATAALVARGDYLVNHLIACADCHTPRNTDGSLDTTRLLGGNPRFTDLDPTDDTMGLVPAPNLTPDPTGLGSWTDDQIKRAFLDGIDDEGNPLFVAMPYYVLHNMTPGDADAIVAYLHTVPPVDQTIPARQPLGFAVTAASPIPVDMIPQTTLATDNPAYPSAQRGRYLAAMSGLCIECHTEPAAAAVPLDLTKAFAGNRVFTAMDLGLPVPPFPTEIHSTNITPDANGIAGWAPNDIRNVLQMGVDPDGSHVCPPMPVGPAGAYGGITNQDALDIGTYLTTLAPVDNGVIQDCITP